MPAHNILRSTLITPSKAFRNLERNQRVAAGRICAEKQQLSICTNKTCRKQGSLQIAKFVEDLHLDDLTVERTGCLAKCGSGPNMVLSPLNVTLSHVNTIAKMREVLETVAAIDVPETLVKATELRIAANNEARSGKLEQAAEMYTEAINLDPPYGKHMLYSNRSGVLLSLKRAEEAARDADSAAALAPKGFRNAFVRQVEAHCALNHYTAAAEALQKAASQEPSFQNSMQYRDLYDLVTALEH